jgi:hypothetical protein
MRDHLASKISREAAPPGRARLRTRSGAAIGLLRPAAPDRSRGRTQVVEILGAAGYSRLDIDRLHAARIVA